MDGLVSNFALIAGVAGGQAPQRAVLVAGRAAAAGAGRRGGRPDLRRRSAHRRQRRLRRGPRPRVDK
ncbi:hypothetical protein ACQEU3_31680 [Spirillospora sp. CA-253888]